VELGLGLIQPATNPRVAGEWGGIDKAGQVGGISGRITGKCRGDSSEEKEAKFPGRSEWSIPCDVE